MKQIRDLLIIVVLGGFVIWFIVDFIERTHQASVQMDSRVVNAKTECILDGVTCEFTSVTGAEEYLKSDSHLAAVKKREEEAVERKKTEAYTNCLLNTQGRKQVLNCDKARQK
jgi:hypothetical protein